MAWKPPKFLSLQTMALDLLLLKKPLTDTHVGENVESETSPPLPLPSHNFVCTICLWVSVPTRTSLQADHFCCKTSRNLHRNIYMLNDRAVDEVSETSRWFLVVEYADTKRSSNNEDDLTKRTQYIYIIEKLRLSRLSLRLLSPLFQIRSKFLDKERQKACCFPLISNLAFRLEFRSV